MITIFIIVLCVTALISGSFGLLSWRNRERAGAKALGLAAGAITLMATGYAAELASSSLEHMLLTIYLQYVGIVLLPVFWLWFALSYTGRDAWLRPSHRYALLIIPAVTLGLVLTNASHSLIWQQIALSTTGGRIFFNPDYGIWFWVHTVYSYSLILPATGLLVFTAWRTHRHFRRQALVLALVALAPLLGNALYLLRIGPGQSFDLTPLFFGFSVSLVTLLVTRGRLLEVVPVARELSFEQMRDGVVVIDPEGRVVDLNLTASNLFNRPMLEVIGQPLTRLLPLNPANLERYLSGPEIEEELAITTEMGVRWFAIRVITLRGWRGRLKGRLIHGRDVTDRRQSEEMLRLRNAELEALYASLEQELSQRRRTELALAQARDLAEASSRAKSTFINNMSHELRTPLTSIIGYSQLIKLQLAAGDTAPMATELDIIIKAARHQVTMINDLLDLAKIEAGHMQLNYADFALAPLLNEVGQMVRPLIDQANNRFVVEGPEHGDLIYSDQQKIRQILINLLSNAAKFTEHGTITLHAARRYVDGKSWVQLRVSDTGIGIPAPMLTAIFGEFTQVDSSYQKKYSGTGLGLSICKHYAELMGGWISVESKEQHGSHFCVNLPCDHVDVVATQAALHTDAVGNRSQANLSTWV